MKSSNDVEKGMKLR